MCACSLFLLARLRGLKDAEENKNAARSGREHELRERIAALKEGLMHLQRRPTEG